MDTTSVRPGSSTNETGGTRVSERTPSGDEFVGRPLDKAAVTRLYNAYATKLLAVVTSQLELHHKPDVVEDAVADVFTELTTKAQEGAPLTIEKDPFQYLVGAVRHRIGRKGIDPDPVARAESEDGDLSGYDVLRDPAQRRPLSIILCAEALAVTQKALAELSDDERQIVELVQAEGLNLKEVAERLGLSHDVARKAHARAKKKLDDARGRYSSTFIQEADSYTYKPRTRRGAIQAIELLPKEHSEILNQRYVLGRSEKEAAKALGISPEGYAARLAHAEELFQKKYGMGLPDELEAALRNDVRA